MLTEAGIFLEIRVGEKCGPLALGIFGNESVDIGLRNVRLSLARVEQEHVVIDVLHFLEFGELGEQAGQLFLAEGQVVEFVLEDDARVVESVLDDEVAGSHLLLGEGNLCQIVFTFVWIVLRAVGDLLERVLNGFLACNGVEHFLRHVLASAAQASHDGLVGALPVVDVFALAPLSLEGLLALLHGHGVVEIPLAALLLVGLRGRRGSVPIADGAISLHLLLSIGLGLLALFFLLLFLQGLDDAVDGGIAILLAHLGKRLQGVLQVDCVGVGNQFVEHFRAT